MKQHVILLLLVLLFAYCSASSEPTKHKPDAQPFLDNYEALVVLRRFSTCSTLDDIASPKEFPPILMTSNAKKMQLRADYIGYCNKLKKNFQVNMIADFKKQDFYAIWRNIDDEGPLKCLRYHHESGNKHKIINPFKAQLKALEAANYRRISTQDRKIVDVFDSLNASAICPAFSTATFLQDSFSGDPLLLRLFPSQERACAPSIEVKWHRLDGNLNKKEMRHRFKLPDHLLETCHEYKPPTSTAAAPYARGEHNLPEHFETFFYPHNKLPEDGTFLDMLQMIRDFVDY